MVEPARENIHAMVGTRAWHPTIPRSIVIIVLSASPMNFVLIHLDSIVNTANHLRPNVGLTYGTEEVLTGGLPWDNVQQSFDVDGSETTTDEIN